MYNQGWTSGNNQRPNFGAQPASYSPNLSYIGQDLSHTNIPSKLPPAVNHPMNSNMSFSPMPHIPSMNSFSNVSMNSMSSLSNNNLSSTNQAYINFQNMSERSNFNMGMGSQSLNNDTPSGQTKNYFNKETEAEFQKIIKLRDEIIARAEDSDLINTDDSILSEELKDFKDKYIRFKLEKIVRGDKESKKLALVHKHEGRLDLLPAEELVMTKEYEDQLRMAMDIDEQQVNIHAGGASNVSPASQTTQSSMKSTPKVTTKLNFAKSSAESGGLDYGSDDAQTSTENSQLTGDCNDMPISLDLNKQVRYPSLIGTPPSTSGNIMPAFQTHGARPPLIGNRPSTNIPLPHDPRASMFSRRQRRYEDVVPEKKIDTNSGRMPNKSISTGEQNKTVREKTDYKTPPTSSRVFEDMSEEATKPVNISGDDMIEAAPVSQLLIEGENLTATSDNEDQNYRPYEAIVPTKSAGGGGYYSDQASGSHSTLNYSKQTNDQYPAGYLGQEMNDNNRAENNILGLQSELGTTSIKGISDNTNRKPTHYKWNYEDGDTDGSRSNYNERSKDPIEVFGKPQYGDLDEED